MPRFVLLHHNCPGGHPRPSHCDLMFEANGALRTWAIDALPCSLGVTAGRGATAQRVASGCSSAWAGVRIATENGVPAERLPDHRLAYLDYEGPVSNDRGTVSRLDAGEFVTLHETSNLWIVELSGHLICGRLTLERNGESEDIWQLQFQEAMTP
jgi:hypothetical protein